MGGNSVQSAVNLSSLDIQNGKFDVIALIGAECGYTQAQARRAGHEVEWRDLPGTLDWTMKPVFGGRDSFEAKRGIGGANTNVRCRRNRDTTRTGRIHRRTPGGGF